MVGAVKVQLSDKQNWGKLGSTSCDRQFPKEIGEKLAVCLVVVAVNCRFVRGWEATSGQEAQWALRCSKLVSAFSWPQQQQPFLGRHAEVTLWAELHFDWRPAIPSNGRGSFHRQFQVRTRTAKLQNPSTFQQYQLHLPQQCEGHARQLSGSTSRAHISIVE